MAGLFHRLTFVCAITATLHACGDNLSFVSWGDIGPDSLVFLLQDNGTASGPWFGGDRIEFEQDNRAKSLLSVPIDDFVRLNATIDTSEEALLDIDIEPAQQPECEAGAVAEDFDFFEAVPPAGSQIYDFSFEAEELVASATDPAMFLADRRLRVSLLNEAPCPTPQLQPFSFQGNLVAPGEEVIQRVQRIGRDEVVFLTGCCLYYARRSEPLQWIRLLSLPNQSEYGARFMDVLRGGASTLIAVSLIGFGSAEDLGGLSFFSVENGALQHLSTRFLDAETRGIDIGDNGEIIAGARDGSIFLGASRTSTLTKIPLMIEAADRVAFAPDGRHIAFAPGQIYHGNFRDLDSLQVIDLLDKAGRVKQANSRSISFLSPTVMVVAADGSGVHEVDLARNTSRLLEIGIARPDALCDLLRFCSGADQVSETNSVAITTEAAPRIFSVSNQCSTLVTYDLQTGCASNVALPRRKGVLDVTDGMLTVFTDDRIFEADVTAR